MKILTLSALLALSALPDLAAAAAQEGITTLAELRAERTKIAARPRRLIANNDGCDAIYFPKDKEPTAKNFIDWRTAVLAGSQVGTVSYCSISSGFGFFTHNTKAGEVLTRQPVDYGLRPDAKNITADLIRQGTDTLRAVTDFAHANGLESFWSMRMNDTHDLEQRPEKPYFLFPPWKVRHPDMLVGDHSKRTPYGRWSSVDYARAEVRDLAFRFIEEVCRDYDVDGVELDFFRHLCYFKSTANGGKASAEEVAAMTGLMRRIRTMTEEIGLKRQRPILVTMRLPDSTGYALDMGFDLETWLKEGLMDILITTDYFRLNPWDYSVALGHRHGVKVYPALTDPRVKGESRFLRTSDPAYRARAANAWASGADGLYLFNLYDIDRASPLWRELGDPAALAFTDKEYFVSDLDGKPTVWLAKGDKHQTIPVLTPTAPVPLNAKQTFRTHITLADDFAAAAKAGKQATAALHIELPGLNDATRITAALNGKDLPAGKLSEGWLDWPLAPEQLRKGVNDIAVTLQPAAATAEPAWRLIYDGSRKPARPWQRDAGSTKIHEEIRDGALLLADRGTASGDYCYYRSAWGADPESESTIEARVKVVSGSSFLIFSNGVSDERLELSPTGIGLHHHGKLRHAMNTTDAFHTYRIVIQGTGLRVHVDGALCLDAPAALTPRDDTLRNEFAFGAANSTEKGEALWREVKYKTKGVTQPLHDIVVSIGYGKE